LINHPRNKKKVNSEISGISTGSSSEEMSIGGYRGGSLPKVNDDNDIDRTPEYKRFIDELAEFHRERG
jgi:hypothetical protein